MYSTRRTSGSHPLIPPDPALSPPASVLPPPASVLVPPDSPFLHRRIPDSRFIVAPRAPHITIQFLQGKGSLDLFSLDLPLPASCHSQSSYRPLLLPVLVYLSLSFPGWWAPWARTSSTLLQFLQANNEIATHFVIGVNILQNPQIFQDIVNAGHDIAVHTWTHPYMTTLSNLEILGQLGWTMEIIRNSTGGRVPKYWRPPTGDSDVRVRAIAKEVFGLTTVIWNSDTWDWKLTTGGTTQSQIHDSFVQWLTAPSKTPGIVTLEHELSTESVKAFMDNYPMIKPNGWQTGSLARLIDPSVYQNSKDLNSPVALAGILVDPSTPSAGNSSAPGTSSSTSQSLQTQTTTFSTTTSSTSTGNGNQSSQTSNAALVSRDIPWNLAYILISFCAPTLMAMVSFLA
ncbi:putative carbohydrate esterase family 4 protein [Lyophyllum shimeji]|uniref:chitin deacetylase n=1 Tax=Lyophyllum shimeji TaxID=47721 RepID=A0A9P3PFM7_LYOSH|nr:putative carbohydrate esterase family 4 protein [Lyophyllum shimeji]